MKNPRIRLGLLCSTLLLTACDPKFESTSDLCAAGEDAPVRASYADFEVTREEKDEYQFYLQNMLMGMTPATGEEIDADTRTALDIILAKINEYMDYEIEDGVVRSANNPLDFVEHLIASTDADKVIGAFEAAQEQVALGIEADDGVCNYNNDNIVLSIQDTDPDPDIDNGTYYKAIYSLTYTPFDRAFVQQALVLQKSTTAVDDPTERLLTPYTGLYQAPTENFRSAGFTQPALRQAIMNNNEGTESVSFDDGRDINLGQVQFETLNTYCETDKEYATIDPSQYFAIADRDGDGKYDGDLNEDNLVNSTDFKTCAVVYAGSTHVPDVLVPRKDQCKGGVLIPNSTTVYYPNDTDRIEKRSLDLSTTNPALMDLQRVRVEVDYKADGTQETRIYGSKYREAIYDPVDHLIVEGSTPYIENPTRCETQAVLDEFAVARLAANLSATNLRVTPRQDPFFDVIYETDEEGNYELDAEGNRIISVEPTPRLTFKGRPVQLEQPCTEDCTVTIDSEAISLSTPTYDVTPGPLYDLYVSDILRELTPANSNLLTEEQRTSRNAIEDLINGYLDYNLDVGLSTSADNPLDYLGHLVRSQSNPHLLAAFNEFAECLEARNKTCVYSNDDIDITNTGTGAGNAGTYQLHYSPQSGQVTQSWQMAESIAEATQTYTVTDSIRPEDFNATVKLPTVTKLAEIQDRNLIDTLNIEDSEHAGELLFVAGDAYCDTSLDNRSPATTPADFDPTALSNCGEGVTTRTPAKGICNTEANKIENRSFSLGDLTGLQRVRVEVDYTTHQTQIFASAFVEKIMDSDGVTIITNPTDCEKDAVRAELPINSQLAYVTDANFEGPEAEPVMTFAGTIPPTP